ncbi:Hypothetical_protein [Hexamita inflata]|uniref:Hypothetical_protein n=1 Tax=Hexamita inflata TaxID=28002 RepID=A0ABP1HBJ3_9EUKA
MNICPAFSTEFKRFTLNQDLTNKYKNLNLSYFTTQLMSPNLKHLNPKHKLLQELFNENQLNEEETNILIQKSIIKDSKILQYSQSQLNKKIQDTKEMEKLLGETKLLSESAMIIINEAERINNESQMNINQRKKDKYLELQKQVEEMKQLKRAKQSQQEQVIAGDIDRIIQESKDKNQKGQDAEKVNELSLSQDTRRVEQPDDHKMRISKLKEEREAVDKMMQYFSKNELDELFNNKGQPRDNYDLRTEQLDQEALQQHVVAEDFPLKETLDNEQSSNSNLQGELDTSKAQNTEKSDESSVDPNYLTISQMQKSQHQKRLEEIKHEIMLVESMSQLSKDALLGNTNLFKKDKTINSQVTQPNIPNHLIMEDVKNESSKELNVPGLSLDPLKLEKRTKQSQQEQVIAGDIDRIIQESKDKNQKGQDTEKVNELSLSQDTRRVEQPDDHKMRISKLKEEREAVDKMMQYFSKNELDELFNNKGQPRDNYDLRTEQLDQEALQQHVVAEDFPLKETLDNEQSSNSNLQGELDTSKAQNTEKSDESSVDPNYLTISQMQKSQHQKRLEEIKHEIMLVESIAQQNQQYQLCITDEPLEITDEQMAPYTLKTFSHYITTLMPPVEPKQIIVLEQEYIQEFVLDPLTLVFDTESNYDIMNQQVNFGQVEQAKPLFFSSFAQLPLEREILIPQANYQWNVLYLSNSETKPSLAKWSICYKSKNAKPCQFTKANCFPQNHCT